MKILIIILLLSSGSCFSKVLNAYSCGSYAEAESCSMSCTRMNMSIDFLINKNLNSVLRRIYIGGDFMSSDVYKNCVIFDENNWDCSDEPLWIREGKWLVYNINKMSNGIYSSGVYTSKETKYSKSSLGASCAK